MVKGELPHRIKAWHERYGPIVRVAPDELSFLDATAWRDIYPKNFIRPNEYKDQPSGKTAANLIACTEYHPWLQTVSQFKTAIVVGVTKFYPMVYSLLMAITPPPALKEVMEMWKITEHKVRQRVGDRNTDRPDLVSTMLAASVAAQTSPNQMVVAPMTREEMEVNAMMIVAAGSEYITILLCGANNYLLRNPVHFLV
jgi:hypothetical protein